MNKKIANVKKPKSNLSTLTADGLSKNLDMSPASILMTLKNGNSTERDAVASPSSVTEIVDYGNGGSSLALGT